MDTFFLCVYKSLLPLQINFSSPHSEVFYVNMSLLKKCFITALQDKTCEMEVKESLEIDDVIKFSYDSEETKIIFGILGLLNSIANPVLYAWIPSGIRTLGNTL